jgi:hypothetical protein
MTVRDDEQVRQQPSQDSAVDQSRRATLRRLGRFAAVTPPAVALILAARTKPALAVTSNFSSRQLKEPVTVLQLRRPT